MSQSLNPDALPHEECGERKDLLRPPCLPPESKHYNNFKCKAILFFLYQTTICLPSLCPYALMPSHPWYSTNEFYQPPFTAIMGSIELPTHVKATFPAEANSEEYANSLDAKSPLRHLRDDFVIPTKKSLKTKTAVRHGIFPFPNSPISLYTFLILDFRRNNRTIHLFLRQLPGSPTKSNPRIPQCASKHLGRHRRKRSFH